MKRILVPILPFAIVASSCSDDIPMVNLGIDDVYYIPRMSKLPLKSALTGSRYQWTVNGKPVSEADSYIFLAQNEGRYDMTFDIIDPGTPYHFEFTVNVIHEEVEYSTYISRVYEYCPAPGQFVNTMPQYEEGDTYADILKKCEESISGTNDVMISLGSYGGYVTFGFDHTVVNVPGQKDFQIWGNAFYELLHPEDRGGSAEPGIVMVSYDTNCDGVPNDPWYELAGSAYGVSKHKYELTYYPPDPDREVIKENSFIIDTQYIKWTASDGEIGYVAKNSFHKQDYWPKWVDEVPMKFSGTCLPQNGIDLSGTGRYYVLYAFDWGYVDNHPNDYPDLNSFDISWAIDSNGNHVDLPGVDFVRVYTGINQYCGWLGETSTELSKARDLHIDLPGVPLPDPLD